MGCWCSKLDKESERNDEPKTKQYSWDQKPKINVEDYMLEKLEDKTIVRMPGTINGQQIIIDNCKNCKILLLDNISTISIDNCENCYLIVGPVKDSLFIRNCKLCLVVGACQQFRTRDCGRIDMFMCCTTTPIIESSYKMRFGCYQFFYEGLKEQFKKANLNVFNNTWDKLYDFTPNPDAANWTRIEEDFELAEKLNLDSIRGPGNENEGINKSTLLNEFKISFDSNKSVVPLTRSNRRKHHNQPSFVVLFYHEEMETLARVLIEKLNNEKIDLVNCKHTLLPVEKAEELFTQEDHKKAVKEGPLIGLEFDGENSIEKCKTFCKDIIQNFCFYISSESSVVTDIEKFYLSVEMQMN